MLINHPSSPAEREGERPSGFSVLGVYLYNMFCAVVADRRPRERGGSARTVRTTCKVTVCFDLSLRPRGGGKACGGEEEGGGRDTRSTPVLAERIIDRRIYYCSASCFSSGTYKYVRTYNTSRLDRGDCHQIMRRKQHRPTTASQVAGFNFFLAGGG